MNWIYISPHPDDAIYSCGGLIWEQTHSGENVEIWTICAGNPPDAPFSDFVLSIHKRWGTGDHSMIARRSEDVVAARILKAHIYHFNLPDCIYRRKPDTGDPVIMGEKDLWQPTIREEYPLMEQISEEIELRLPENANVVSPMGMGGHMDHHFVRSALERLKIPLFYYADYPYAADPKYKVEDWVSGERIEIQKPISVEGLEAWKMATAAYQSQISTFWGSLQDLRLALDQYYANGGGARLWTLAPQFANL